MIFSIEEEEKIIGFLEDWLLLNRPLSRKMFIVHVRTICPNVSDCVEYKSMIIESIKYIVS